MRGRSAPRRWRQLRANRSVRLLAAVEPRSARIACGSIWSGRRNRMHPLPSDKPRVGPSSPHGRPDKVRRRKREPSGLRRRSPPRRHADTTACHIASPPRSLAARRCRASEEARQRRDAQRALLRCTRRRSTRRFASARTLRPRRARPNTWPERWSASTFRSTSSSTRLSRVRASALGADPGEHVAPTGARSGAAKRTAKRWVSSVGMELVSSGLDRLLRRRPIRSGV